jgi:hypothetical protein
LPERAGTEVKLSAAKRELKDKTSLVPLKKGFKLLPTLRYLLKRNIHMGLMVQEIMRSPQGFV